MVKLLSKAAALGSLLALASCTSKRTKKAVDKQVVFITGAGSGLGRRLARVFSDLGAKVAVVDINFAAAEATAKLLKGEKVAVQCDVGSPASIKTAADIVRAKLGPPNILVNNAGVVSGVPVLKTSIEAIERTFRVNALAHIFTIKELLPDMIRAGRGHIVSIASAAGIIGTKGLVDYCGSKFAAVGIDEALRLELRLEHPDIKTTCVIPYFINTGMFDGISMNSQWLLPLQDEEKTALAIVNAVREDREVLLLPISLYLVYILRTILSVKNFDRVVKILGLSHMMDTFKGRPKL